MAASHCEEAGTTTGPVGVDAKAPPTTFMSGDFNWYGNEAMSQSIAEGEVPGRAGLAGPRHLELATTTSPTSGRARRAADTIEDVLVCG